MFPKSDSNQDGRSERGRVGVPASPSNASRMKHLFRPERRESGASRCARSKREASRGLLAARWIEE